MSTLPRIYLARHGETQWALDGKHTSRTDISLTERGEKNARQLGERLLGLSFAAVYTSPLVRARRTCELSGFNSAIVDDGLHEWQYGDYEGRKTKEIRAERPDWSIFKHGCPGGESPAEVAARADGVIERLRQESGNVLVFSHAHFLRIFAVRWLGFPPAAAKGFRLSTASLSIVGYEHERLDEPTLWLWNDDRHVTD